MEVRTYRPLLLAMLLLLTGCTSLKLEPQTAQFKPQSWEQRRSSLEKIHEWGINGAFSVQQNDKVNIANYSWQQNGSDYQIRINSSLNLYSLFIEGRNGQVTLWESKQKSITAQSPEALMKQRLGWSIPISYLAYWIRGLPAKTEYQSRQDAYGHLSQLRQQGWRVKFTEYTNVQRYDLPRILQIEGHGLQIKIAIKQWTIRLLSN